MTSDPMLINAKTVTFGLEGLSIIAYSRSTRTCKRQKKILTICLNLWMLGANMPVKTLPPFGENNQKRTSVIHKRQFHQRQLCSFLKSYSTTCQDVLHVLHYIILILQLTIYRIDLYCFVFKIVYVT